MFIKVTNGVNDIPMPKVVLVNDNIKGTQEGHAPIKKDGIMPKKPKLFLNKDNFSLKL